MAVIEIAKIKVRRGQEGVTGIPTLDRVWMGNRHTKSLHR